MNRIRFFRRRKSVEGWTQRKLAEIIGVRHQDISYWESEQRRIPEVMKQRVSDALGEASEVVFPDKNRGG